MFNYIDDILKAPVTDAHDTIGLSRENRPVKAAVIGRGNMNISLIAGCHADEPVGPRLLRKLQTWLKGLDDHHKLIRDYKWWIVPHANPDGEQVNKKWYRDDDDIFETIGRRICCRGKDQVKRLPVKSNKREFYPCLSMIRCVYNGDLFPRR